MNLIATLKHSLPCLVNIKLDMWKADYSNYSDTPSTPEKKKKIHILLVFTSE